MSARFQLLDLDTMKPISLQQVEDAVCEHFNIEPNHWHMRWFDSARPAIGDRLAAGKSFLEIEADLAEELEVDQEDAEILREWIEIVKYLKSTCTVRLQ